MLKDRCLRPAAADAAIGAVLVLLQYLHPEEEDLLHLLVARVAQRASFRQPDLLSHLCHVDFLEEISALFEDPQRKVVLDICPPPPAAEQQQQQQQQQHQQQRKMGTRGANKEEQEELRSALRAQAARAGTRVGEGTVIRFLEKNGGAIMECLSRY